MVVLPHAVYISKLLETWWLGFGYGRCVGVGGIRNLHSTSNASTLLVESHVPSTLLMLSYSGSCCLSLLLAARGFLSTCLTDIIQVIQARPVPPPSSAPSPSCPSPPVSP